MAHNPMPLPSRNFNPRAREGRDEKLLVLDLVEAISIHAPARGATPRDWKRKRPARISIHAPARGATPCRTPSGHQLDHFNPRAREGRDARSRCPQHVRSIFQSTRPRGARRQGRYRQRQPEVISIHAPARGATDSSTLCGSPSTFQSTRPRGARRQRLGPLSDLCLFQSTRPRGARLPTAFAIWDVKNISIHAPARGATRPPSKGSTASSISIHAPARGATVTGDTKPVKEDLFQSTRPRGARRDGTTAAQGIMDFNPRAREGRDISSPSNTRSRKISIHAPARGATQGPAVTIRSGYISIHAPARGATASSAVRFQCFAISIHAPARGATPPPAPLPAHHRLFQSTRPRGARPVAPWVSFMV